jgi:hypothetical protein
VEIEGEDYDGQSGVTKQDSGDTGLGQSISGGSGGYAYFDNVDFSDGGAGAVQLRVNAASATTLDLRADTQTGTAVGTCNVTGTSNAWATQTCTLTKTVGVHKLYVNFGGTVRLNWMKFQAAPSTTGTGGTGGSTTGAAGTTGSGTGGTTGAAGTTGTGVAGTTGTSAGTAGTTGSTTGTAGTTGSVTGVAGTTGTSTGMAGTSGSTTGDAGTTGTTGAAGTTGASGTTGITGGAGSGGGGAGCGCDVAGSERLGLTPILGFAAVVFGLRRRRARRAA